MPPRMGADVQESESKSGKTFYIRLKSGRVLGPLDLERIARLVVKKQILGEEVARESEVGEWRPISQFPELFNLLVGRLEKGTFAFSSGPSGPGGALPGTTQDQAFESASDLEDQAAPSESPSSSDQDATLLVVRQEHEPLVGDDAQGEATRIGVQVIEASDGHSAQSTERPDETFSSDRTVLISRDPSLVNVSQSRSDPASLGKRVWQIGRGLVLVLGFSYLVYDQFLSTPEQPRMNSLEIIRPKLPEADRGKVNPSRSIERYNDAFQYYQLDTVLGYKLASERFREAITLDPNNVKALAMLASSYLNLIDSSNKDENYFDVLTRLIDMSRAKSVDLPESVIADVEFFIVVNKAEAAQARVIDYTKAHSNYGPEMFYYLALAFFSRGDSVNAARFIEQLPDSKAFSAKVFYLRGQIAERLKDVGSALVQYNKAIAFNSRHVKSRLRLAWISNGQGKIGNAATHLNYNLGHVELLSPKELSETYFLHSQLMASEKNWKSADESIESAVKLDPENHSYLLELYSIKAKAGSSIEAVQGQARMYYFLVEGERLVQAGRYHDALIPFLQARQADDRSPIPPVKIGDMFSYLHDVENARKNYKLAADRAPNHIQIWSKYIKTLIQSFDWSEANKAMDRFRKLNVSQSAIDKAAADMYQQQGRFVEAQMFYKKAMARPSIDPEVYIAYAKSLMSTKNYKDAPFFFALALRFDPLNFEAMIGTAKCIAETESIERAISLLQDELRAGSIARAEYLAAIAELQMQKGNLDLAQENVDQAIQVNPDYAYSWKLQAQIHMSRESVDRQALDKALASYKSYSDRNLSDPSGYLERYQIFVRRTQYDQAKEELNKIFEIYPKYPNLHYYLGALYGLQGNHKLAIEEFKAETQNNPMNAQALIGYGKELLELNEPDATREALTQLTKAMQVNPRSADAKQNAGWANFKLKNYTAGVALIREAIALDPANPAHYRRLGLVYRDSGDPASACVALRKYIEMEPDASDRGIVIQGCL